MLLPLPTPAEMAIWDHETIHAIGIPGVTLMESASREAVRVLLEKVGSVTAKDIFCFAGSGNNGGDAFAMARHLIDLGANVTIFHTKPKKKYKGEARTNLMLAQKLDIPLKHLARVDINSLSQPDIILDGLLGTGFKGELRPDYLKLIRAINRMGDKAFVLSIDIPSGLDGLTGTVHPEAIVADATVTFQAMKLGLTMPKASQNTGVVHVCPIGIPEKIQKDYPVKHYLISKNIMAHIPNAGPTMHKGTAGHVLVIGGSQGLTGAPHLTALGALRSGTGLVTVACPGGLADSIKSGSPDIMTLPLGTESEWTPKLAGTILSEAERFDAIVVGPGMGRTEKTVDFLKTFIADCPSNTVLDADALFALAQFPKGIQKIPQQAVLTPHPGEMARLLKIQSANIQTNRLAAVQTFVDNCAATLILKGAGTLVANQIMTCLSPFSEPNLAVGGSGDVLSGVIGSLMARGLSPMRASCLGVYWHGLAGHLLKKEFPTRGNLASEIANMLPKAAMEHRSC
ncbi:MAG: NAD(P)H-hydrate dehydratase [Pseudodesulfovibrio sp.]|nr:NAD(P)H-hydrate dehydratase [Pseudodesulfovibrio sp.]